ncbi:MAG: YSC84-related protein [Gammaproteobacteria bacterium]
MHRSFSVARPARLAALALAIGCTALAGCTTTTTQDTGTPGAQSGEMNSRVDATLSRLYEAVPDSRQLIARSRGVLVFPSVLSVSFGIGGEHGDGVLQVGGRTVGHYSLTGGSIGFQAGAQSKAVVLVFMTPDALARFRDSNGWSIGADATVAVAQVGANGSIDTTTMQQPVVGFVLSNAGLMAGVSLQGSKISPINR